MIYLRMVQILAGLSLVCNNCVNAYNPFNKHVGFEFKYYSTHLTFTYSFQNVSLLNHIKMIHYVPTDL